MKNNKTNKNQYLYVKEYRNNLFVKYIDGITGKTITEKIPSLKEGFDLYYVNEDDSLNIYNTIDKAKVCKFTEPNIKLYKYILKQFKDDKISVWGVETIEAQYKMKTCEVDTEKLDFNAPRVLFYDIETLYYGEKINIKYPSKNAITLITMTDNHNGISEAWGYKEDISSKNSKYKHFKNEAELLISFYKKVAQGYDSIVGHNSIAFDNPMIYYRGIFLGINVARYLSPFGIIKEKDNIGKYGTYPVIEIFGVLLLDTMELIMKYYKPLARYSLEYVSKEILGDEIGGKIDYSSEGNLNNLYFNHYEKFVEYGLRDTELLYDMNHKLSLLTNAISSTYTTLDEFDNFNGTVKNYHSLIYRMLQTRVYQ